MNQHLKQRIVGAIVLVSIAIIFVPMLFEERSELGNLSISETNIPEFPVKKFEEKVLPLPVKEEIEQQAKLPITAAPAIKPVVTKKPTAKKPTVKKPATKKPPTKRQDGVKLVPSYIIQVGSFSQERNAKQFADKLKNAGYPAFVKLNSESKKVMYRVWVGPELDRKRAEQNKAKLETLFKLKAIVLEQIK
ncbi:MAG: hypothetical protein DRQ61_10425 [Gammaproteobacteria bacterium]|nr:MAG: hypothetical protein DRQ61_10425 [Gammaproteobacteria bacterium]